MEASSCRIPRDSPLGKLADQLANKALTVLRVPELVTNLYDTFPLILLGVFGDCKFAYISNQLWKKKMGYSNKLRNGHLQCLLDEVETDQAREELDEIMDIYYDSESKFQKNDENKTFELKGKLSNATKRTPSKKLLNHKCSTRYIAPCQKDATTPGLLAMDLVIFNHGQVTKKTPELAPTLLTSTPHQREDIRALDKFRASLHGGSLVVLNSNS
ncbi:hypothetical protein TNCV_4717081 [Trichonephila clavipes]|nr:hypothetical protein TNCV_4717081 [Trichonephila clavipes]